MKHYLLPLLALSLCACSNDDDELSADEGSQKTVTLSRTTSYGDDWIYFSLREGKEVEVSEEEHAESLDWDIAFNRYNVRTNSGTSGCGQGGAYDTGYTDMSAVATVPADAVYTVDTMGEITASFTGSGVTYLESSLNSVLAEAVSFAGPPPTYTFSYQVFIVKTADGQPVKLQLQSFYNDEGTSGYMTFAYEIMD